ncbi:BamA/TamA family outer membrane protein [Pseudoxanthomonas sp. NC8]|nr:BamA/TamA family outer membrane protein [Pseudoxanthomonas sp. NC8]
MAGRDDRYPAGSDCHRGQGQHVPRQRGRQHRHVELAARPSRIPAGTDRHHRSCAGLWRRHFLRVLPAPGRQCHDADQGGRQHADDRAEPFRRPGHENRERQQGLWWRRHPPFPRRHLAIQGRRGRCGLQHRLLHQRPAAAGDARGGQPHRTGLPPAGLAPGRRPGAVRVGAVGLHRPRPPAAGRRTTTAVRRPRLPAGQFRRGPEPEYDSRDNPFTPSRGYFVLAQGNAYLPAIGSDLTFQTWRTYGYGYWPLGSKLVLGGRADLRHAAGDVPFYRLPFIDLRGIASARYQGRQHRRARIRTALERHSALGRDRLHRRGACVGHARQLRRGLHRGQQGRWRALPDRAPDRPVRGRRLRLGARRQNHHHPDGKRLALSPGSRRSGTGPRPARDGPGTRRDIPAPVDRGYKKAPDRGLFHNWRSERDSNPR